MKKRLAITLSLVALLCLSSVSMAAGIKIDGGYLLGSFEESVLEAKANGLVLNAEMDVAEPFGITGHMEMLSGDDFEVGGMAVQGLDMKSTRFDILGTYKLPFESGGGNTLKAVGGYTTNKVEMDSVDEWGDPISVDITISGFLLGASGEFAVMDKLTVNGFFGFGLGMKAEADGYADTDYGLTTYRFGASYQVTDNIAVQGGYMSSTYSPDGPGFDDIYKGFFFGAQAAF